MNRIKVVKNHNYTTINNSSLRDINISLKAKGLFALIMSLPPDWNFSMKGIEKIIKEGIDSIKSAINELVENGYCTYERSHDDKGYAKWVYTFYETKEQNPTYENPRLENPKEENPKEENPIQISKESNKERIEEVKTESESFFTPKNETESKAFEVLTHLNEQRKTFLGAVRNFEPTKTHFSFITARLEKYSVEDLKAVIDLKMIQWASNTKMKDYLVPKTLFNDTNFQSYIQQVDLAKQNPKQFINEQQPNTNGKQRIDSPESIANIYSGLASQLGGK